MEINNSAGTTVKQAGTFVPREITPNLENSTPKKESVLKRIVEARFQKLCVTCLKDCKMEEKQGTKLVFCPRKERLK